MKTNEQIITEVRENLVSKGTRLFECTYIRKDLTESTIVFSLEDVQRNLLNAVPPTDSYFTRSGYYYIKDMKEITLEYM